MRTKPLHLAAAVAIALSGSTVFAQTTGGTLRIAPGTTASSPSTTGTSTTGTSANRTSAAQVGGCSGTGGSSCSATTGNDSAGTTSGTTTTTSTSNPGVVADGNSGSNNAFGSTLQATPSGNTNSAGGSASGTNQTTVDPATTRPAPFAPGGAFGSASGTATTTVPGSNTGNNFLPGTTGAVVLPDGSLQPQTSTQQTVVIQQPAQVQARAATPIFDEVAREGRAKERARRARGDEPRVIGIAPRTDVDRTHQMPDDPIIRY